MKENFILPGQKLVLRTYTSMDYGYNSYRDMVHDTNDTPMGQMSMLRELFDSAGLQDGDEFAIVLVKTGNRPHGNRRYRLQEPHCYGPETDEQMRLRELGSRNKL